MLLKVTEVRAISQAYAEAFFGRFAAYDDSDFNITEDRHVFHVTVNGSNGDVTIEHVCRGECGVVFENIDKGVDRKV